MNDGPWFKFYASDWLAGTRALTPAETGIYITILGMIYERGGPVPRDDKRLARLCNCTAAAFRKVIDSLIRERKIIETDEGLSNERAEKELGYRANRSKKATDSANARWGKSADKGQQNQGSSDALASAEHCDRNAIRARVQKPEARYQKEDPPPPVPVTARDPVVVVAASPPASDEPTDRERVLVAMGHDPSGLTATGRIVGGTGDMAELARWRSDLGLTLPDILAVIAEVMATKRDGPPGSFAYFREAMRRAAGRKQADPLAPIAPAADPAIERLRRVTAEYGT